LQAHEHNNTGKGVSHISCILVVSKKNQQKQISLKKTNTDNGKHGRAGHLAGGGIVRASDDLPTRTQVHAAPLVFFNTSVSCSCVCLMNFLASVTNRQHSRLPGASSVIFLYIFNEEWKGFLDIHAHIYIYIYTYIYIHIYIYIYIPTCCCERAYFQTHSHMRTHAHTHARAHTQTYT
jgi:hypothetical protein